MVHHVLVLLEMLPLQDNGLECSYSLVKKKSNEELHQASLKLASSIAADYVGPYQMRLERLGSQKLMPIPEYEPPQYHEQRKRPDP